MHALETLLPDTLLVLAGVWLLLSLLFLEKVFSWCLHTEQGFVFRPWLPGLYSYNLCFSFAQTEQVERNYIKEKKAAVKEFEDKVSSLKRQEGRKKLALVTESDKATEIKAELDAIPTPEQYERLRQELSAADAELKQLVTPWLTKAREKVESHYADMIRDVERQFQTAPLGSNRW